MIGKMEAIATIPSVIGIFRGRLYIPMSEYAPREMRADLEQMLKKAETDPRIVIAPHTTIYYNTADGGPLQELVFDQWVEQDKSHSLVKDNAWFYSKLGSLKEPE